jgi:hypothetical protein
MPNGRAEVDTQRIHAEVVRARNQFANVDTHFDDNGLTVRAALMTSLGNPYVAELVFHDYPSRMPSVFVRAPRLMESPHRYKSGNICYLHPAMWNPGRHDLTFVLARVAKWLNKYDIYCQTNQWVGAEREH